MIRAWSFTPLPLSVPRWWPLITRARLERQIEHDQQLIDKEFSRAKGQGRAAVHRWAVEANFNMFGHPRPEMAARAAFQEAETMFRPEPLEIKEI